MIAGLCQSCGKPMSGKFTRCEPCLVKERVWARRRRKIYTWRAQQARAKNDDPALDP